MVASRDDIIAHLDAERRRQNANLLRIYNYYRIVVGASLLVLFIRQIGERLLGSLDADAFVAVVAGYITANVLIAIATFALPNRLFDRQGFAFLLVAADTIVLTLLMHFSGGVTSGLGSLIIVSVAAGSILVTGRISTVLPAIAAICVLYEEIYLSLITDSIAPDFVQAGLLGALYFGTSLFIQSVSRRLRASEITSLERAAEVASLERLNHLIVQRMRTGIMVVDATDNIRLINEAARNLLDIGETPRTAIRLPAAVTEAVAAWREDRDHRPEPYQTEPGGPEVRLAFSSLSRDGSGDTTVFIEDNSELQQQAQQLKLAALGRLSASIAHEIRNPLGAISHAAQLLRESPNLDKADLRLADIIQSHSRRMNGVIENVLELSRRRAPEPRVVQLGAWLEEFRQQFLESREDAAQIDVDAPEVTARVDVGQLTQVLTNLVHNGLRYSEAESGRAWAGLHAGVDPVTERPYVDIEDIGTGIDKTQTEHLFEPFYTTEKTGTGLGLYISRELCEANQAQLTYSPREGGGSRFRILFPHPRRNTA